MCMIGLSTVVQVCLSRLSFLSAEGDDEFGDRLMIHSAKTKLGYNQKKKKNNKVNTKIIQANCVGIIDYKPT